MATFSTLAQWCGSTTEAFSASAPPETASHAVTIAFRVAGTVTGAVHFLCSHAPTQTEGNALEERLCAAAKRSGEVVQVVWRGVTRGPWEGHVASGAILDVSVTPLAPALQRLHLGQSLAEAQHLAEGSVLAIGEEMRGIYELSRAHAHGLERVTSRFQSGTGNDHVRNVAETIEALAAQIRDFGSVITGRTERQANDVEQARAWTHDIVKLGQSIAAIASNARILTFNARLESARIGEAGRGFAVIAGSIQELASQIRQTNQSVSALAENLAESLPRLGREALDTAHSAKEAVGVLSRQLNELQELLVTAREESAVALTDSASTANELQMKANAVITHLQFQDRASQMLADVERRLPAILELAGLVEQEADRALVEQVGALGRALADDEPSLPQGTVELF